MRKMMNIQRSFMFNTPGSDLKVVSEYQEKYTIVDELLEENSKILNLIHADLKHFSTGKGRESVFTSENIFRMLLVKWIEGDAFRDLIIRVSDSAFLRNFVKIGLGPMMDFTFLSRANKFIRSSTWESINLVLQQAGVDNKKISGDKLRLDSTLYEANVHYPTDSHLLWDSYRVISRLVGNSNEEYPECRMDYRFHDRKIKQLYTYISTHSSRLGKRTQQKITNRYKILIERVENAYEIALAYVKHGRKASPLNSFLDELESYLPAIAKVTQQSRRRIFNNESVPNGEKVFSIFEPHTELIKRGKSGHPVEFGHMVTIGQTGEKFISYFDVMEHHECDNTRTDIAIENHKKQFGSYPSAFTADKNYYKSMEHVYEWEKKIDTFSVCKKGNRNKEEIAREHDEDFKEMQKFRAGCEGSISVLKRAFGLKRCFLKGFKSFAASVGCLVVCHNLVLLSRL